MPLPPIDRKTCVIRNTAAMRGRTRTVAPGQTAARYLHYGRIVLARGDAPVSVDPGPLETGLICVKGQASVTAGEPRTRWSPTMRFTFHGPRPSLSRQGATAAIWWRSRRRSSSTTAPVRVVRGRAGDPGLHFAAGDDTSRRELNILLGKNVKAGRIMAGITFSKPGNWTSWPPHEHAVLAEEPTCTSTCRIRPSACSSCTPTTPSQNWRPSCATVTWSSCRRVPPNVAGRAIRSTSIWMMAAFPRAGGPAVRVVNVHPDFAPQDQGLDKGRAR